MKLKKFISSVLALCAIASTMTMASYAEGLPTIKVDTYKYENDEANYVYEKNGEAIGTEDVYEDGVYIPDGMTGYLVVFSVENVSLKYATKGANVRFDGIEMYFDVENADNIDHMVPFTYGMIDSSSVAGAQLKGDYVIKTGTTAAGAYPTSGTATTVPEACAAFIVLKDDAKQVTFTPKKVDAAGDGYTQIMLNNYTGATAGDQICYMYNDDAMTIGSFKVGTAPVAPAKPVISGTTASTDVTVADDNKGKVWNGIKIEDVANGKNYKVKFTDSTVGAAEASKTFDLNLNNKEVNGDIDFAIVLKTAKDLANITMEILYDLAN